jgi:hypothetical protein
MTQKKLDDLGEAVALQSPSHFDKESGRHYKFLTAHEFQMKGYPRPPKLEHLELRDEDMDLYIDLNPCMLCSVSLTSVSLTSDLLTLLYD